MNHKTHTTFTPTRPSVVARMKRENRKQLLLDIAWLIGTGIVAATLLLLSWAIIYLVLVASGAPY